MRNQLRKVLMACVALLAILVVFAMSGDHPTATNFAYILLPTLPLLSSLYAMHWVRGSTNAWWHRIALPSTAVAMGVLILVPSGAKAALATLFAVGFSAATIGVIFQEAFLKQYNLAMSEPD